MYHQKYPAYYRFSTTIVNPIIMREQSTLTEGNKNILLYIFERNEIKIKVLSKLTIFINLFSSIKLECENKIK